MDSDNIAVAEKSMPLPEQQGTERSEKKTINVMEIGGKAVDKIKGFVGKIVTSFGAAKKKFKSNPRLQKQFVNQVGVIQDDASSTQVEAETDIQRVLNTFQNEASGLDGSEKKSLSVGAKKTGFLSGIKRDGLIKALAPIEPQLFEPVEVG